VRALEAQVHDGGLQLEAMRAEAVVARAAAEEHADGGDAGGSASGAKAREKELKAKYASELGKLKVRWPAPQPAASKGGATGGAVGAGRWLPRAPAPLHLPPPLCPLLAPAAITARHPPARSPPAAQHSMMQEDVKEREARLREAQTVAMRAESQLSGLKTVLATKTTQCHKFENEVGAGGGAGRPGAPSSRHPLALKRPGSPRAARPPTRCTQEDAAPRCLAAHAMPLCQRTGIVESAAAWLTSPPPLAPLRVQVRTLEARLKDAQRSLAQENDSLRSGLSDAQEQIKVLRGRISLQVEAQAGVQEQLEASR
jgi:hypothetical protein